MNPRLINTTEQSILQPARDGLRAMSVPCWLPTSILQMLMFPRQMDCSL